MAGPAGWVAKVLPEQHVVAAATQLGPNLIQVERTTQSPFLLGVLSAQRVTYEDVAPFLDQESGPSFIVNIPTDAPWTGEAIEALQAKEIAFGRMGDLHRALREHEPRSYVFKEYDYVERRLRQHRSVTGISRLFDRVWRVHRGHGGDFDIAISNEYDLTADEVRTMRDRYGGFDVIFHTNPMGRITEQAQQAAEELGIELVGSRDLFVRLSR